VNIIAVRTLSTKLLADTDILHEVLLFVFRRIGDLFIFDFLKGFTQHLLRRTFCPIACLCCCRGAMGFLLFFSWNLWLARKMCFKYTTLTQPFAKRRIVSPFVVKISSIANDDSQCSHCRNGNKCLEVGS
jgi:hypothetical protein